MEGDTIPTANNIPGPPTGQALARSKPVQKSNSQSAESLSKNSISNCFHLRTGHRISFGVGPNLSKPEKEMVENEQDCSNTKVQQLTDNAHSYPVIRFLGTASAVPNMYRNGYLKNKAFQDFCGLL